MSLDLPQALPQVERMGQALAQSEAEAARRLPAALEALLSAARLEPESLQAKIARAGDRWRGALPSAEPLDAAIDAPAHPDRLTVIGADGSQIYPDRHARALYYMINVGSIVIAHGSGEPPATRTRPELRFAEDDLYGEDEGLITAALINGLRDAAELGELADLAEQAPAGPALTLLDNGLLLWLALQVRGQTRGDIDRVLKDYLGHLDRLRARRTAVAGYIDRPRSADVLALLHLARLDLQAIDEAALRLNPFRGLSDRALFARRLRSGQRSACFVDSSPVNRDFKALGHAVRFFYLNTGPAGLIARVEVPEWVAEQPDLIGWAHAGLIEQCRTTGGFPYALVRAHELAVITQPERQEFDRLLAGALRRHGLAPQVSQKAQTKRWTGQRKRHRL